MLSGVILVVAFGLVAVAGLVLTVALYLVSGRPAVGSASEHSQTNTEGGQ